MDDERKQQIRATIPGLTEGPEDFTADDKPKVGSINLLMPEGADQVTADERDEVWAELQEEWAREDEKSEGDETEGQPAVEAEAGAGDEQLRPGQREQELTEERAEHGTAAEGNPDAPPVDPENAMGQDFIETQPESASNDPSLAQPQPPQQTPPGGTPGVTTPDQEQVIPSAQNPTPDHSTLAPATGPGQGQTQSQGLQSDPRDPDDDDDDEKPDPENINEDGARKLAQTKEY